MANMKRQLTNCHRGETKQFGYGFILIPLMLEWVPALQLQDMVLDAPKPREPRITRCAHVMPRGGGRRPVSWGAMFHELLEGQTIFVEDCPYAGMDFHGDPNMQLPPGEQWDDDGKALDHTIFCILFFMMFFGFFHAYVLMRYSMLFADVGPVRLVGLAPEVRRDPQGIKELALAPPVGDSIETVAQNLKGLMVGIPDYMGIKEVPIDFQVHIVGVIPRVHRLLRRVA